MNVLFWETTNRGAVLQPLGQLPKKFRESYWGTEVSANSGTETTHVEGKARF